MFLASCSNLLFVPIKHYPVTPENAEILYEDIFIEAEDGITIHGWKMHADDKTAGTIIFFHGNGDNVSTQMPNTFWLAKEGYDLYVFDYREYGQSQGEADLGATISDMELTSRIGGYYQSGTTNHINPTSQVQDQHDSFSLWNVNTSLAINDQWTVALHATNIFNEAAVTGSFPLTYFSNDTGVNENYFGNNSRNFIALPRTITMTVNYIF